jgi:Cytochrome c peroxidase
MRRRRVSTTLAVAALVVASLTACSDSTRTTAPINPSVATARSDRDATTPPITAQMVRELAASRGIGPLPGAPRVRPQLVKLGQALAFDKVLSGNRDISCMTCHLPAYGTSDGRSVSIGQGGIGLGPQRTHPSGALIPRNAPPLFNLNAMMHLFWDGRVSVDANGNFHTPAGAQLTPEMTRVFEFGALSALPMFPVSSAAEMRGDQGSNELANIRDDDFTGIWAGIMRRLGEIPAYRRMFENAYPGTRFEDMTFAHASNAIAGFIVDQYTFANSPWDQFLAGRDRALTQSQLEGAQAFLTLKCSTCHTGAMLSDDQFHDVAMAQIGPGEGNGVSGRDDFGRMNVTNNSADRYRFRTTPLRNVELTAPYGHDGAISSLRAFIEHYSESDKKLMAFDPQKLEPSLRGTLLDNVSDVLAQRDTLLNGVVLTDDLVDKLMEYMSALTDDAARDLSKSIPKHVPSGLSIDTPIGGGHR